MSRAIIAPTFKASPWRRGGFCRRAGTVPRTGVWHQPGPGIGLLLVSLLVLAGLIAAAAGPLSSAPAAPLDRVLPDLVSDPPEGPVLQIYDYGSGDNHLLLRFNGYVHNRGSGALEMRGSQPSGNRMTSVAQRIRLVGGTYVDDTSRGAQIIYEDADGHDHWHLKDVSRYTLWNQAKTAAVAPSMKVGFCLEDGERRERNGPATKVYTSALTSFCRNWEPEADSVYQGVSAGWRDIYFKTVAFQWVDVSDVPPGVYRLGSRIDPQNVVIESNESNNGDGFAAGASTIPGYVAGPVAPPPATLGQPTTIQLSATTFGSPGARRFRVESAPKHGTINRAVGETFTASQLVYTPDPGYKGPTTSSTRPSTHERVPGQPGQSRRLPQRRASAAKRPDLEGAQGDRGRNQRGAAGHRSVGEPGSELERGRQAGGRCRLGHHQPGRPLRRTRRRAAERLGDGSCQHSLGRIRPGHDQDPAATRARAGAFGRSPWWQSRRSAGRLSRSCLRQEHEPARPPARGAVRATTARGEPARPPLRRRARHRRPRQAAHRLVPHENSQGRQPDLPNPRQQEPDPASHEGDRPACGRRES